MCKLLALRFGTLDSDYSHLFFFFSFRSEKNQNCKMDTTLLVYLRYLLVTILLTIDYEGRWKNLEHMRELPTVSYGLGY
jgi:hypothetical protein